MAKASTDPTSPWTCENPAIGGSALIRLLLGAAGGVRSTIICRLPVAELPAKSKAVAVILWLLSVRVATLKVVVNGEAVTLACCEPSAKSMRWTALLLTAVTVTWLLNGVPAAGEVNETESPTLSTITWTSGLIAPTLPVASVALALKT